MKTQQKQCHKNSPKIQQTWQKDASKIQQKMLQGQTYFLIDYNSKIQVLGFLQNQKFQEYQIKGFENSWILGFKYFTI